MKRTLSLALALVMLLGLVLTPSFSVAAEDKPFEGQTLRLAGLDGGYGTDGWKAVIKGFEKMTGATVEATFEKKIYDVIRPEIQAGNAPDIIYNSIGQETGLTETMIKEDMLLDLTDVLDMQVPGEEKTVKDKLIAGFTDTAMTNPYGDGKTYLAPLFYSPTGLFYNKALFGKDGKYELPATMEDFLALGESAKEDGIALFTYPTAGYMDSFIPSLLNEVGGPELYSKLMSYDVDAWKEEATPMFETLGKILAYIHPSTVANANGDAFTQNQLYIMTNEALFMPNGTWVVDEMSDAKDQAAEGFEWGFMPLPAMEKDGDRYAFTFFEQAFVSKDTEVAELAKTFIAYLYSDEAAKAFIENKGGVQPILGAEEFLKDEDQKLFYSIYEDGAKAAMGGFQSVESSVEGVSVTDALYQAVDSVANGELSVEDWQAGVVDAVQQIADANSEGK